MGNKLKKILAGIMVFGDAFMILVSCLLLADGEFGIGMTMLAILGIDTFLTFDYMKTLTARQRLEEQLRIENERLKEENRRYKVNLKVDEEDLTDLLHSGHENSIDPKRGIS